MIVIWILINGLQDITVKHEQNSTKEDKITKVKGKETIKTPIKK